MSNTHAWVDQALACIDESAHAPAGTPAPVIDRLNAAFVAALNAPDVRTKFAQLMAEPVPTTPRQFAEFMQRELPKYESVVNSGASVD